MSYGQKKRVTIASILILEPEILVLDEPTAAQDLQSYREIMDFLDELNRRLHLTMIMITHDMYLITEYSDRTLVFADGKIIADSSPYQILENEDFVKYFLTESKEGYCTYFATAAVLMYRCAGIPARYVEGYVAADDTIKSGAHHPGKDRIYSRNYRQKARQKFPQTDRN